MNTMQKREQCAGTALIMAMIMVLVSMGVVASLFIVVQVSAQSSEDQSNYLEALETAEIGINKVLADVRSTAVTNNGTDLIAFAGASLEADGYTRIVTGNANSTTYTVRLESAYFAWKTNNDESGNFLREVTQTEREDPNQPVFDLYQITAASGTVGQYDFRRGIQTVVELRKRNVAIPSALYIDNDPDPVWNGNAWTVSGKDHAMAPSGNWVECPDCGGTGTLTGTNSCVDCGGDGVATEPCADCNGTGRVPANCATCGGDGLLSAACPDCGGTGWDPPNCGFCGGDGKMNNGMDCPHCAPCATCGGAGQIESACPDCAACATCGGDGENDVNCATCGGTGEITGEQPCGTCGGTGMVHDPDNEGGGQPVEADFETGSGDDKPAVGYDGSYSSLGLTTQEEDQISTYDDTGASVEGEDAFVSTKIDLRELAAAFVGGPASDPLQPDTSRVDNTAIVDGQIGDINNFEVTYIAGDAGTQAGQIVGGGVLIVDGDIHISGKLSWYGLVIILGDMTMSGGGNGIHVFGSMMVESESVVSGQADIWWSQEAINKVMTDCNPSVELDVVPLVWRVFDKADVANAGM